MDNELTKMLVQRLGDNLRVNEPMSVHTTFGVGGPADLFVSPDNIDDLRFIFKLLKEREIPCFVLGAGSNLLVRDGGIRGVVISMRNFTKISEAAGEKGAVMVFAGAGARLSGLCRYAADRGLFGMNFAIGIPGSVGGAMRMNAGTWQGDMASVVSAVTLLWPHGAVETVGKNRLNFSYRCMEIIKPEGCGPDASPLIVEGQFSLGPGKRSEISAAASAMMENRMRVQPAGLSAGCFFKNPGLRISAGALIDRAGLKGFGIGAAYISEKHANFIINTGGASAADILALAAHVRKTVHEKFNEVLVPEVVIVGEA